MKLVPGILALTLTAQCVYAVTDEAYFVAKMVKTGDFIERNQDTVWPGFHMIKNPTIIYIGDYDAGTEHLYALNYHPGKLPWRKLKMESHDVYFLPKNLFNEDLYQYDGQFYTAESQASFIDIEDADAINAEENFRNKLTLNRARWYLKSESAIAKDHLVDLGIAYNSFYDATNVKLLYLENAALLASIHERGRVSESALKDAAAIHHYRLGRLTKDAATFDVANEIYHGLPAFISWRSMNLSEAEYFFKSQQTGCRPLTMLIGMNGLIQCSLVGNPSFSTAVFGYALDQRIAPVEWKHSVEQVFKTPADIVNEYYQINDVQAKSLTEAAMLNPQYEYSRISRIVDDIINVHLTKMNEAITAYAKDEGIEAFMPWELTAIPNHNDSLFGKIELYTINTNKTLRVDLDDSVELADDAITVDFNHIPYAYTQMVYDANYAIDNANSWSVFKLDSDTRIIMDGEKIKLGDFVRNHVTREFRNLRIQGKRIKMIVKDVNGQLDASEGVLKLRLSRQKT